MLAARSDGRTHSDAGHARHGKRHEARTAAAARSTNTGPVTAATGTAEYTAVPPPTCRMTPTHARASHPARSRPHVGRGARGSSESRYTSAMVAAVLPAMAVSTTPPASTAAIAEARPGGERAEQ